MKFLTFFVAFLAFNLLVGQTYVRQGKGDYNEVLYTWDGKYLRQGKGDYHPVIYTIEKPIPQAVLMWLCL